MGVYTKGMEMPDKCCKCNIRYEMFCPLLHRFIADEGRRHNCPLIGVPPHGRLIDADALMNEIQETCKRLYGTDDITASPTLSAFKLYIGEAPTILEAEE